jgi:choloylglycine hydrolase
MRNVSVPRGISTPGQPNIANNPLAHGLRPEKRVYYFEDTASPSLVWVRLDRIDFRAGSGVRKLTLAGNSRHRRGPDRESDEGRPFKFLAPH